MSKDRLTGSSMAERAEWAARVSTLRRAAGLKQSELAEMAGVARQTISNMETGAMVPQEDVLRRVLDIVGVDLFTGFEAEIELWLVMMGSLIQAIPLDRRSSTVNSALVVLASGIPKQPVADVVPDGDTFARGDRDVADLATQREVHKPPTSSEQIAAMDTDQEK